MPYQIEAIGEKGKETFQLWETRHRAYAVYVGICIGRHGAGQPYETVRLYSPGGTCIAQWDREEDHDHVADRKHQER